MMNTGLLIESPNMDSTISMSMLIMKFLFRKEIEWRTGFAPP